MGVEVTKMSSKGQVVIPQEIREEVEAEEGTLFVVITSDTDTIILKKIQKPSKEALLKGLEKMARENRRKLEAKGLKELNDFLFEYWAKEKVLPNTHEILQQEVTKNHSSTHPNQFWMLFFFEYI